MGLAMRPHDRRKVVYGSKRGAVRGDGGFLIESRSSRMRSAEQADLDVIGKNRFSGSIRRKAGQEGGRHSTSLRNPDVVKLAESFGMPRGGAEGR